MNEDPKTLGRRRRRRNTPFRGAVLLLTLFIGILILSGTGLPCRKRISCHPAPTSGEICLSRPDFCAVPACNLSPSDLAFRAPSQKTRELPEDFSASGTAFAAPVPRSPRFSVVSPLRIPPPPSRSILLVKNSFLC